MGLRIINKVYTDLSGRTGDSIQGGYLDPSIIRYDVEYDAKLCLSVYLSVIKKGNTFTLTGGKWANLISAFNGANLLFSFGDIKNPATINTTIDYVDGAVMALTDAGTSADGIKSVGYFQVTDVPELFDIEFNLVQNSLQGTKFSIIDNETQRFSAAIVNSSSVGGVDSLTQLGNKSGGSGITSTITGLASVSGNSRWKILVNYKNWVLFNDKPYMADDCIGDYIKIKATSKRGNKNAFVEASSKNLGNTGYQDESLNGGATDYKLNTLAWTDSSSNAMVALDPAQVSTLSVNLTGTFTSNHRYGIRMFRLPQDALEYKNRPLSVERNLSLCMNDTLVAASVSTAITGETNTDGAAFDIANFEVTNNTTNIDVSAEITPNAAMITLLAARGDTDKDYRVILTIDDTSKSYKDATTANILIDQSNAVKNIISLGNYPGLVDFDMVGADGITLIGTPSPLIESTNKMNVTFTLPKNTSSLNPWLSMTGQIVAQRISTGERFAFESFVYDVSQLSGEVPTMVLGIDYTQSRGRKLPVASEFNDVTFKLNPFLDTATEFGVQLNYAFQVGYQSNLAVPQMSNYFQGNKTNNWYNVSNDADWQLKFELLLTDENGTYTDAKDFNVTNYGSWSGSVVKTYEDKDSNVVTRPLANQVNTITATATGLSTFTGNEYATLSIRDENNVTLGNIATNIDPLSSGNPLKPITGQTRLKITVAGSVATLVCLIDTELIDAKKYTIVIEFNGDV